MSSDDPPRDQQAQALEDLWLWASERRTHLDTDPVPDGLGQQVLAALRHPPLAREEDKDHGAGLIGQVAAELAETEPRLIRCEHEYGNPIGKPRMAPCRKCGAWKTFSDESATKDEMRIARLLNGSH